MLFSSGTRIQFECLSKPLIVLEYPHVELRPLEVDFGAHNLAPVLTQEHGQSAREHFLRLSLDLCLAHVSASALALNVCFRFRNMSVYTR